MYLVLLVRDRKIVAFFVISASRTGGSRTGGLSIMYSRPNVYRVDVRVATGARLVVSIRSFLSHSITDKGLKNGHYRCDQVGGGIWQSGGVGPGLG